MKKLDIILNRDGELMTDLLSIDIPHEEFGEDFNNIMRDILLKIKEDEIVSDKDSVIYLVDNVSQEHILIMAKGFILQEWKRVNEEAMLSCMSNINLCDKHRDGLTNLLMSLFSEKPKVSEIRANSREEVFKQLKEQFSEKGLELDIEKLELCKNEEEFRIELQEQTKELGVLMGEFKFGAKMFFEKTEEK